MKMDLGLTDTEEAIYIACGDTTQVDRYKRSTVMRGVMFAILFAFIAYTRPVINPWLTLIYALFAAFNLFEILRFVRIGNILRTIQGKLAAFLFKETQDAKYEKITQDAAICRTENLLRRNGTMLAVFYIIFLAVCLYVMPGEYASYAEGAGSIVMILLFMKLKLAGLAGVKYYKESIVSIGRAVRELELARR